MDAAQPHLTFSTMVPGLHGIALPMPFGASSADAGTVNAYLAEGDPLTLIDCGICTDDAYQALIEALTAYGYHIADIRRLLITHHHADHRGLARHIVEMSGAEVWCQPLGVPWLESPADARRNLRIFTDALFRHSGVPEAEIEMIDRVGDYMDQLGGPPVHVVRMVGEGDSLELAGCQWQVYHTPGHAGSMLCFYQPESRVLLASDHLLRDISSNPLIEAPEKADGERPRRLLDYMREMQRIAALDIDIAYTGHDGEVHDVPGLVESRILFHQKRADKLYGLFDGQPRTLYDLTLRMFPKVSDSYRYLTLSEVLGHIDLLVRDGRVVSEQRGDLRYWCPVR